MTGGPCSTGSHSRLDKWLWATRLFKTRTLATEACKRGQIKIEGSKAKPSRLINPGMIIQVHQPTITRTVKVLALVEKRIGAKIVPDYLEDLTTEEEREKAVRINRENRLNRVFHVPGQGRPDKRQLREIQKFLEAQEDSPE